MSLDEFLDNDPGIPYKVTLINDTHDYIIHPEEKNDFFVSYYDIIGTRIILNLNDIFGFYDGKSIFISYEGKPYELIYLGSISILRYEHRYKKNIVSQAASISAFGVTTTRIDKVIDVYFDLRSQEILPRNKKNFEALITSDKDFYVKYRKDRKTSKSIKPMIYMLKYNEKYPLQIDQEGIKLFESPN